MNPATASCQIYLTESPEITYKERRQAPGFPISLFSSTGESGGCWGCKRRPGDMMRKLKLETENAAQDRGTKVGVSLSFEEAGQQGSEIQGSISLIPKCSSYETLEREISRLKGELDGLLQEAKEQLGPGPGQEHVDLDEELDAPELWEIISAVNDTDLLVRQFNSLSRGKREEIADHVFTQCNVFTGVASVFSQRYNNEEAKLE
jgi:hypothetical protein